MDKLDKVIEAGYIFIDKIEKKFFKLGFKAGYKFAVSETGE